MNAAELLRSLRDEGIHLWCEGDRLRCRAPKGRLGPELMQVLADHKTELVELLAEPPARSQLAKACWAPHPIAAKQYPLSFAQQRMWFLNQLEPDSCALNVAMGFMLAGSLNVPALEKSLSDLVRRHEVFRTTFSVINTTAVQTIAPPEVADEADLRKVDLRSSDASRLDALIRAEARKPFDLTRLPMLRACLFQIADDQHAFVLTTHHAIIDGWSAAILLQELSALYRAHASGTPALLARPAGRYCDYAAWQRQLLQGAVVDELLAYWKRQLQDVATLELPTDRLPSASAMSSGVTFRFELSPALCAATKELARSERVTLYTLLLATFQLLLHRYSRQDDIVVGTVVSDRCRPETQSIVGCFANPLAIRTIIKDDWSIRELLTSVQDTIVAAFEHQDLPFELLIERLHPDRLQLRHPIFQAAFVLHQQPDHQLQLPGIGVEPFFIDLGAARYDILLEMQERGDLLAGCFEYSADLFENETIRRMAGHFQAVLESLVKRRSAGPRGEDLATADLPIHRLEILSSEERDRVLREFNDTTRPLPFATLSQLFERQAERSRDTPAVIVGDKSLSYRELNTRANQLARYLRSRGVETGTCIGLCTERSAEMLIGMLGILKAGGAYVPLDPSYPKERLNFMINDAKAPVVLTMQGLREKLAGSQAQIVSLDRASSDIERFAGENSASEIRPDALAYVIYTSGSTGTPKGVAVPHRAVTRLVLNTNYVELEARVRIGHVSNVCFDAATFEVWGALLTGGSVVVIDKSVALNPQEFALELRRQEVDTLFLTTALFNELASQDVKFFAGLKQVLFGGETVNPRWVRRVLESGPPQRLVHVYGPTECTTFALFYVVQEIPPENAATIPIGKPIANTTAYVLDSHGNPLPPGIPGELYLGGEGLALGYINQPQITRDKFVPHPFADNGALLYRTGDIVRYLADGNIEFIGRADGQVKIRGFRIEPGEVEVVLKRHPSVEDAAVLAREDESGERRLVAYVVTHDGDSSGNWQSFLQGKLPEYMVPSFFVILDKLPLTPNGKVDRHALPAPGPQLKTYRPPRSSQEEVLCEIFADVLKIERIGIEDNFFALGGHSLLAMQVIGRVRGLFGVDLPARALFETPSVAGLAVYLGDAKKTEAPLTRREHPERIPLSYAQERFWFLDRLEGSSAEYKINEAMRLRGELNLNALEEAIHAFVNRHESVRTHFQEANGFPFQVVEPAGRISLSFEDLSGLPELAREKAIEQALRSQARERMALDRGPLFRIGLLKVARLEHILYWSWHHIVTDGWSIEVFKRELAALYRAFVEGSPSELSQPSIQYADYALWQRAHLQGEALRRLLDYWRPQLQGSHPLELPVDRPRQDRQTHTGERRSVVFSTELANRLRALSRRENATLFMSLLAALKVMLFRYTGQEDVSVGIPIANRGHAQTENLIGCLLNTLIVRTQLSSEIRFRDLLHRVREVTLEAYAHQELPFEKLLQELQPERSLNRTPLFQVFMNFINFATDAMQMPGLSIESLGYREIEARFDLSFYFTNLDKHLRLDLVYNRDLFEAATIERMLDRFTTLLEAIVADPAEKIGALRLLTAADQERHTIDDNPIRPTNPYIGFPQEATEQSIGTRFEEVVGKHPTNTAVKTSAHQWSYAELDDKANLIAREILRVHPEEEGRVALLMEHDAPMVAAILGILKAGKAYVPLSPTNPTLRLRKLLLHALPGIVITDTPNEAATRELAKDTIAVIHVEKLTEGFGRAPLDAVTSASRQAYLLYTSGSTGEPKGVSQSHRNVLHHIRNYTNSLHISSDDRVLLLAQCGFDAAVMDIFGALLNGATLLPFDIRKRDFQELAQWMREEKVTIYHSTPSVLRHFLQALPASRVLVGLRLVVMGGEPLSSRDFDYFQKHLPADCLIVNGFGQSEYSFSLQCSVDGQSSFRSLTVPIGYPLPKTEVLLLDGQRRPGQVFGEIAVRSPYLTPGYWRDPELTARTFPDDPAGDGARTYLTGDLGRLCVDGMIEFVGRKDFQVKIRGHRIELGEIESELQNHPSIQNAVVVASKHVSADEQELVAYIIFRRSGAVAANELRAYLATRLPDYMVPSLFVTLDEMPLTPNGKIDRQRLPAPQRELSTREHVPPRTPFEHALADIWKEVLRIEWLSVHDDFFERGGHSLIAARLISQMREAFDVDVPMRAIFEKRTIEQLALYIAELRAEAAAPDEIEKLLSELESLP